jgi:predicted DNA-binding transcriptional regulator AlpA
MQPDGEGIKALTDVIAARIAERLGLEQKRLIDLRELAIRLDLSQRGVAGLIARGELPEGYAIGGVRRWNWVEILAFLKTRHSQRQRRGRGRYDRRRGKEE